MDSFEFCSIYLLEKKLNYISFIESKITLFTSYLTNRTFIVNVGKDFPDKLSCGVQEGSILGV